MGLGDLPQRLHALFVIVRHLSHWYVLPSFKTMSVKRPLLYILTNLCQMANCNENVIFSSKCTRNLVAWLRPDLLGSLQRSSYGKAVAVPGGGGSRGMCLGCKTLCPGSSATVTLTINESVDSEQQIISKTSTMMLSITLNSFLVSIADIR